MQPYDNWEKIAAYFDGDGDIYFSDTSNQPYKLSLSIVFTDQSFEQIKMIKDFLNRKGIITSNVLKTSLGTAYMLAISRFDCVLKTMKELLPHLYKKSNEIRAAIDYYEGKTTGNHLLSVFNDEVEAGRRERHPRKVKIDVPYTHPQGDALMRARRADKIRAGIARTRPKVTRSDYEAIREKHLKLGTPLHLLVKDYPQYSRETIRRVLGRGRGYVLVREEQAMVDGRVVKAP